MASLIDIEQQIKGKTVAVIVAHPDDETLWTGGILLSQPMWDIFVVSLCRGSDADRAPKFFRALEALNADGIMGDLDDGVAQRPLNETEIATAIYQLLPKKHYDLLITHSPFGEYTRHIRHEETGRTVIHLWDKGNLRVQQLWLFAYEDGHKQYQPKPIAQATSYYKLPTQTWETKYKIMTHIYGFSPNSWEAETTPKAEAFWQFTTPQDALTWMQEESERQ